MLSRNAAVSRYPPRRMCELLGMDCNIPTDIVFSFRGFARRGGGTGPHAHGWGLCLYDGHAVRTFREANPAADSKLVAFLHGNAIATKIRLAHIRQKTHDGVSLANVHPFTRELWGRTFSFAHNGKVPSARRLPLRGRFSPIGTTDSEHAFCWLLEQIALRFRAYPREPRALWKLVAKLGSELAEHGTFNFLLSDATYLYARCDTSLCHIVRRHPFSRATLSDEDVHIDFAAVTTPRDRVAVIATRPLTSDETWTIGAPGTLWVFSAGLLRATLHSPQPLRVIKKQPRGTAWPRSTSSEPTPSAKRKRAPQPSKSPSASKTKSTRPTAGTATTSASSARAPRAASR